MQSSAVLYQKSFPIPVHVRCPLQPPQPPPPPETHRFLNPAKLGISVVVCNPAVRFLGSTVKVLAVNHVGAEQTLDARFTEIDTESGEPASTLVDDSSSTRPDVSSSFMVCRVGGAAASRRNPR